MYDVIVVGGGHAGAEAACAAARTGASVALVTMSLRNLGILSCNPSIGGLGKGHIVREIDAFDGIMARAADAAAIHHRMLNSAKGAAVRGPRVQADRRLYADAIQRAVSAFSLIHIVEGEVAALETRGDTVTGVRLHDDALVAGQTVVLATGTFMGAMMFRGRDTSEGGRAGERAAKPLAGQLRAYALPIARLKTGTPPRLDGRTIDWAILDEQSSDCESWTFSPMSVGRRNAQVSCAITRTAEKTHDVIRAALPSSPLVSGAIEGVGPRYCPSIEDKVRRFGDRDGHQIFLEPEGLGDPTVYPNGISTSLDVEAQERMIGSIAGLEHARITMHGYAVEYDHLDPRSLRATLESKAIKGLFCAGQINGTTGYEEAAGQGLIAGLNAAALARNREPVVLDRASSYLGVMIDDLTLQGVSEPYRMLTARAEYRLSLRADNAETRLGAIAAEAGSLSSERQEHQRQRADRREALRERLNERRSESELVESGARVSLDGTRRSLWEWLRLPGVETRHFGLERSEELEELEQDARYAPYIERQSQEIAALRADEKLLLPATIDYAAVPGLSTEMVERLAAGKPRSLSAASRIRGITPAALTAVLLYTRKMAA